MFIDGLVLWGRGRRGKRREEKKCTVTRKSFVTRANDGKVLGERKRLEKSEEMLFCYFQRHFIFHNVCSFEKCSDRPLSRILYTINRYIDQRAYFDSSNNLLFFFEEKTDTKRIQRDSIFLSPFFLFFFFSSKIRVCELFQSSFATENSPLAFGILD